MAARYDLFIDQGSTFTRDFVYKDPNGNPVDLTGYTARMMIRRTPNTSGDPIFDSYSVAGSLTIVEAEGRVVLELTDEVTQAFPAPLLGVYDIEIESSGGVVTRLVQGSVKVDPNVTRA